MPAASTVGDHDSAGGQGSAPATTPATAPAPAAPQADPDLDPDPDRHFHPDTPAHAKAVVKQWLDKPKDLKGLLRVFKVRTVPECRATPAHVCCMRRKRVCSKF